MNYIPDEVWICIIRYLDLKDVINICNVYNRLQNLCDTYPCHIYKEMLRVRGFRNFENFNIEMFINFCKIDFELKLNVFNVLYAYEIGYIDVVKFLLDNINKKTSVFDKLDMKKIAEYVHSYWSYNFKGIGYLFDNSIQGELMIYLIDFNINKVKDIEIPDDINKYSYTLNKIYTKIDFQSMTTLFLNIAVIKNDWEYIKNAAISIDIIGMGYYEDIY